MDGDQIQIPTATVERTEQYKKMLLDMWEVIKTYESKVRAYYLMVAPLMESGAKPDSIPMEKEQQENINNLISLSIGLWYELVPKMKGKDGEADFKQFESLNVDPAKYLQDTNKVFDLTRVLRYALETLEITKFEKELR
jgi:hypothetical protein